MRNSASGTPHEHLLSALRLTALAEDVTGVIERVYEEDEDPLRFFAREGIRPETEVKVLEVARSRGTITVGMYEREIVLGRKSAQRIWIRE